METTRPIHPDTGAMRTDSMHNSKTSQSAEPVHYDRLSRALHWSIAVLVLVQFTTGWIWGYFERGGDPRFYLFRTHIAAGYIVLALATLRVLWRLAMPAPPLPDGTGRAAGITARATHCALYLLILIQPMIGIVVTTAWGKSLGWWVNETHIMIAYAIAAMIALHIGAALWHQFLRRDGLLYRMLPSYRFAPPALRKTY